MDNQLFRDIQTDLDLNGPILSFTTQPVDVTINAGQTATFTAVATVSFPGDPTPINSGTIGYQWYGPLGVLTEGTKYVGTKTTTLQITNVTSPTDVGAYYVQVDYVPSDQTGNAVNEPLRSDNGNLISPPVIEIIAQPTPIATIPSADNNFNVDASLSDNGTDIGYQWQLDGENVSDGTVTKSTVELIPGTTEKRVTKTAPSGGVDITYIPAGAKNVLFNVCGGAGGNGGGNFSERVGGGGGGTGGRGGYGMEGWFYIDVNAYQSSNPDIGLHSGITVGLFAGRRGNDGLVGSRESAAGGTSNNGNQRGGPGGAHGWGANNGQQSSGDAGGGGGGGASSMVTIDGHVSIVAAGGGGGGGAFNSTGSQSGNGGNGMDAGPVRSSSGPHNLDPSVLNWETSGDPDPSSGNNASPGHNGQGIDTPGGGGGGAGAPGGGGGHHGHRPAGSPGGTQGVSVYTPSKVTYRSGSYNPNGNGWASVSYTVDENAIVPTSVTRTTTISGSSTNQLTLNTDGPGIGYTVRCNVNSSIASNSPLISDDVGYQVESTVTSAEITVEGIGFNNQIANISTTDLANGELTLDTIGTGFVGPVPTIQLYSLYAPDKDVDIEMDLYGGGGATGTPEGDTGGNDGGEGGFGRIRFTMKQNEEYVIAGLTDNVNTPFLYRKASLIACVGEGGKSNIGIRGSSSGKGGDGGGIGIGGAQGGGNGAGGQGGYAEPPGGLGLRGSFGGNFQHPPIVYMEDSTNGDAVGGVTISCTKGIHWRQQGLSACADIIDPVLSHFRLSDGREVTNSGLINRGYKAGYNIIETAGGGRGGYRGGNGARGGNGGTGSSPNGLSGGGGSGYTDGSVTIVSTTQGGSKESAKVVIRVVT